MGFTATLSDADQYFRPNNHLNAYDWSKVETDQRTAAFNQAKRELEVYLDRDLEDPVTATEKYRDDYALFEQALYILMKTPRTKGPGGSAVIDLAKDEEKEEIETQGLNISPMAQRFLMLNRVKLVRG